MQRRSVRSTVAGASAAAVLAAVPMAASADEAPPITPYRPSVSSPAQLPAAGQLEAEFGGLRQRAGDERRDSLPYLLKLAFDSAWGVLLGGEAHVRESTAGDTIQGLGDTTLTLKRAWSLDDSGAAGLEFALKLPTAGDGLGSGKADYGLNAIYSRDIGALHMDANLNALRLGATDAGTSRLQLGASAAFSTALSEHWAATAELSGTRREGVEHSAQLLGALTYSPTKRLTFDIGLARARQPAPGLTQYFAGVVFPIARLF